MYRAQKDMSLGLGNTNGEEWYKLRSNAQQKLLRPKEVQRHLPSVNQVAKDFVSKLAKIRNDNLIIADLRNEVGKWSLENAGLIVFDKRLGCLDANEDLGNEMVKANADIFYVS